ncbi:hypothetical protein A5819_000231 [Enterococcus sp. 7E2_DIV0204]|uniref:Uncharacterized protein n=1 Tax=Candidatus Enterococcus lemimoniae TaxID=1834167 RepID=A0ABZ2T9R9_9ENTE|nr:MULTISPECIES: hypothetical protein [unclassified Enterococcus]OTN87783.1 hypothetical protein A5819_000231 [Enterococcus sp. 7E2_DIV0204]OTO69957.1 hypothetical protein A5866_002175 [Enterococcus sp. 12C11_DIV0727]OTP49535.1 hypothetical protein A5884_002733 [Enterococcus sp. 7D2_DIV0200]
MKESDFIDYLTVALKNLGYTKTGILNAEGEVKRLIKQYSTEEIKAKVDKIK